jgi:fucose permease
MKASHRATIAICIGLGCLAGQMTMSMETPAWLAGTLSMAMFCAFGFASYWCWLIGDKGSRAVSVVLGLVVLIFAGVLLLDVVWLFPKVR